MFQRDWNHQPEKVEPCLTSNLGIRWNKTHKTLGSIDFCFDSAQFISAGSICWSMGWANLAQVGPSCVKFQGKRGAHLRFVVLFICFPSLSIPRCEPWCWYIYLQNWVIIRANVGKYSIHGAYGILYSWRMVIDGYYPTLSNYYSHYPLISFVGYPLVNIQKDIEHDHLVRWFTHQRMVLFQFVM